jgi:thiamine biosynthesis lipoprotein
MMQAYEARESFACFGSRCAVLISGDTTESSADASAAFARRSLLEWHERFSRFIPESELSRLNADPRRKVPVTPLMARFAQAVHQAGSMTVGLVDATLIDQIENAGYAGELPPRLPLRMALELTPERRRAGTAPSARWREIEVDRTRNTVVRPPGLKLDSGGLAKGIFADVLGEALAEHGAFAVNCAGDLTVGGTDERERAIEVESPFDGQILHTFELSRTGVATSGIGRRSWLDEDGRPAHHLLDPATGRPAFTGVVQVTALAPSALQAEIQAKAAVLSGPQLAAGHLAHGGVIVFDDGSHQVIAPPPVLTLSDISGPTQSRSSSTAQHA